MRETISALLTSLVSRVPMTAPSLSTVMRSAIWNSSSSLWLT